MYNKNKDLNDDNIIKEEYDKENNAYSDEQGNYDYDYINEHKHSSYNDEYYD